MNTAITKFKPDQTFKLNLDDDDNFVTTIKLKDHQFDCIGKMACVVTTCVFDPGRANAFAYRDRKDIIGTWNQVTEEHVQKNATMLFGNRTFTVTSDNNKALDTPTTERGELTTGGGALTALGKSLIHRRFLLTIMAGQCLALVRENGCKTLQVH